MGKTRTKTLELKKKDSTRRESLKTDLFDSRRNPSHFTRIAAPVILLCLGLASFSFGETPGETTGKNTTNQVSQKHLQQQMPWFAFAAAANAADAGAGEKKEGEATPANPQANATAQAKTTTATLAANSIDASTSKTVEAKPTTGTLAAEKKKDDGLIDFNLKNANIDVIMQFISKHTGKSVMKSKSANVAITISSPKKITKEHALDLIYDNILLQGFVALETEDTVKIVSAAEAKAQDIMIFSGPLPEDIRKQRSRLIRRVITLNAAKASAIQQHLKPLLDKYADISADDNTNKLIITDTVRNIERYELILKELDMVEYEGLEVKIVPLKYAEAPTVCDIVRSFILGGGDSKISKKISPGSSSSSSSKYSSSMSRSSSSRGGVIPGTSIIMVPLTRTNSIMLSAPKEKLQGIIALINQLDVEKPKDVNMHIVHIERADPDDVARTVMRLFPYSSRLPEKDRVTVMASDYLGSFIVVASDKNFETIEKLVLELDAEKPKEVEIRIVPILRGDPDDIADSLMTIFTGGRSSYRSSYSSSYRRTPTADKDRVRIVPLDDQSALIVSASAENHKLIQDLLKQLDAEKVKEVEIHVLYIERGDAADIARAVEDLFPSRYTRYLAERDRVKILPIHGQNALIVSASKENFKIIEDLVTKLDAPKKKEVDVYVIDIEYAEATIISGAITSLFPRERNMAARDVVEVIPTYLEGTIVVSASKENYEKIMDLVRKLDTEKSQKRETKTYKLTYLDAEDTAEELTELYGSMTQSNYYNPYSFYSPYSRRSSRDEKNVTFVPVIRTNSIMVIGPPSEFELIESLIKDIDIPMDKEDILPKIYPIKNADAQAIEKVLNTVFGNDTRGASSSFFNPYSYRQNTQTKSAAGRLAGKINFSADENTNSIIVTTNNKFNFEIVDEVIATLDKPMPELANTLIVSLEHANATELANELNALFGTPTQQRNNQQQQQQDEQNQRNFNPFVGNWGGQQRRADERPISNLIDRVRVVPDVRTNSLLITAASYHFSVIEEMIRELDRAEPQVLVTVQILEVTRNADKRIGVRWSPEPGDFSGEDLDTAIKVISDLGFSDYFADFDVPDKSISAVRRGIISSSVNMTLLMQLLEKNLASEIHSKTAIYISNNKTGKILSGKNIFRSKGVSISPQGGTTEEKESTDVGITLEITPIINDMGNVMMKMSLIASQQLEGDTLQNREYNTEMAINSGETAVLGGVELENEETVIRKIPILGDIPILGFFFRNKNTTIEKTDLYVFITPEVIETSEQAAAVVERTEKVLRQAEEDSNNGKP